MACHVTLMSSLGGDTMKPLFARDAGPLGARLLPWNPLLWRLRLSILLSRRSLRRSDPPDCLSRNCLVGMQREGDQLAIDGQNPRPRVTSGSRQPAWLAWRCRTRDAGHAGRNERCPHHIPLIQRQFHLALGEPSDCRAEGLLTQHDRPFPDRLKLLTEWPRYVAHRIRATRVTCALASFFGMVQAYRAHTQCTSRLERAMHNHQSLQFSCTGDDRQNLFVVSHVKLETLFTGCVNKSIGRQAIS